MGVSFVRALGFGVKVIPAHTSFFSKFIGSCTNRSYGGSFLEGPALLAIVISNWVASELILPKVRTRQCRVPTINQAVGKRQCRVLLASIIDYFGAQETGLPCPPRELLTNDINSVCIGMI